MKIEVHKQGGTRKVIEIDEGATRGATVGVNLWNLDGTLFAPPVPAEGGGEIPITYWSLILEIPPNVVALANTTTTGLYAITAAGTSATRSIQPAAGQTTVSNGNGVSGDPTIGLADVTPTAGGTLQKYGFDAKGRRSQESAATTDDLAEGAANLYYTADRVADVIVNYLGKGPAADRPATPDLHPDAIGLYYADDDLTWSAWDGSVWIENAMLPRAGAEALVNAVNDAAAASAGVLVGGMYRNGSVLMVRIT